MERLPLKRQRVGIVPVQVKNTRVGYWDETGGVFTQENPRLSATPKESKFESSISSELMKFSFLIDFIQILSSLYFV